MEDELLAAGFHQGAHAGEGQLIAEVDAVVIRLVCESHGQDAVVDQVRLMDAGEALRHHRADAQVQRHQGGVLAAGALAVVAAGDEDAAALRLGTGREILVHGGEAEVAQVGHIGAEGQELRVGRRDVVGGDIVLHLEQHLAADIRREGLAHREGLDVGAAHDFNGVLRAGGNGRDDQVVVHIELLGQRDVQVDIQAAGIGQHAGEGGDGGRFAGNEVDARALGAAAAEEVAVVGAHGDGVGLGRLTHADAGAAGGFQDARACGDHVRQRAVAGQHGQHLLGAGADDQAHVRVHGLALQDASHAHHIGIRRVGAGADEHLIHLDFAAFLDSLHDVGHVGLGHQGLQGGKVDLDDLVVGGIRVGLEFRPVGLAALGLEERAGHVIRREDGGGRAQLRAHVGDGGALRDGQRGNALADVLHHLAHAALDSQPAQDLQDDILGRHAVLQLAGQLDAHDLGAAQIIRAAAHGHRHVQAARADGQHTDAAAGGGMGIAAQQGVSGHADALQLHLMADAVAGLGAPDAVLLRHGLDILVVVRVFEAGLQGVVVNIGDRLLGLHPIHAHGLELQIGHGAGGILGEGLVDADGNLRAGHEFAGQQVRGEDLLRQVHKGNPPVDNTISYIIVLDDGGRVNG